MNLLCAANQISKSSTLIRKAIEHSTNKDLWPKLWPHIWPEQKKLQPQFWYLYPSAEVATTEFEQKWEKEFMPAGKFKDDPIYGWTAEYEKKYIKSIRWNNGAVLHFKFYSQDIGNLQTATIHEIFADEEMPEKMFPELSARLIATDGYFNMVFTATLGEMLWYRAMEAIGTDTEAFKDAFKQTVSMYDCLIYDNGSLTPWTEERIAKVKATCSTPQEVLRRVYGRFVKEAGKTYPTFSPERHYIKPRPIPMGWSYYAGVDIGSGGATGHPAAITFVAISPKYDLGYVFRGWRGDGVLTESNDVLNKFRELRGSLRMTMQCYDHQAKDFDTISTKQGDPFIKAEKSHEIGEGILNTLFKNGMLFIFDLPELHPLGSELLTLNKATPKTKAKDDYIDSLRYAVAKAPWDFTAVKGFLSEEDLPEPVAQPLTPEEYLVLEIEARRGNIKKKSNDLWDDFNNDISYWNEEYGT